MDVWSVLFSGHVLLTYKKVVSQVHNLAESDESREVLTWY